MLSLDKAYCLRLANGHRWSFMALDESADWLDMMMAMMELEPCQPYGEPRLIFVNGRSEGEIRDELTGIIDPDRLKLFPNDGWKEHKIGDPRTWSHKDIPDVICKFGSEVGHAIDIIRMWRSLYLVYRREQESGGLPFHAGLVEKDGMGVLLAGQGGAGKSTCCRRIVPHWRALGDDEALIVLDDQGQYVVHPFPTWSDYLYERSQPTWNVEQYVPLRAIFFLEKSEVDEAVLLGQGYSAALINESATQVCKRDWRKIDHEEKLTLKRRIFDNSCEIARKIPAFKLHVSPSGWFWEEMEKVLKDV